VAQETDLSRRTIRNGIREVNEEMPHLTEAIAGQRIRRPD